MNQSITGVVQQIDPRSVTFPDRQTGAPVNKTAYDFYVNGIKYGAGFKAMPCNAGDTITFTATQKGEYWNAVPASIVVTAQGAAAPAAATPAAAPAPAAAPQQAAPMAAPPGAITEADKQTAIRYQSARKDALDMVSLLVATESIDLGASSKAAKANRAEIVDAMVTHYTARFFNDIERAVTNGVQESAGDDWSDMDDFSEDEA